MDQFVVRNLQYAFSPDSLETTRAMNADAGSPSDISALFDRVAYEKCEQFDFTMYPSRWVCTFFETPCQSWIII